MEKRYYIACILIFMTFLGITLCLTLKNTSEYKNENLITQQPCEKVVSIGVIQDMNCNSSWISQKRDDFNIYELFGKIQEEFVFSPYILVGSFSFLILFMPCAYIREKKKKKENLEENELKKNTYQYAYIPVVLAPVLLSIILFICGFVSNDYNVIYDNWNGALLTYILLYYLLIILSSTIYSIIHIQVCLISAHVMHGYIKASILSIVIMFALEWMTKTYLHFPSLMSFGNLNNIESLLEYLLVPGITLLITTFILKQFDKKKMRLAGL